TDIRRDAKRVFEQVRNKNEVVLVVKNKDHLSVVISPDRFQSIIEENESLWEELTMTKSKKQTAKEPSYPLKDIISGKD
ncbi:MAG: hypothetical protein HY427_01770, partial [Candidatus Levybacteria bacterium]|nr:hypothetical protein [Candidatus Levybacteria bacterium]